MSHQRLAIEGETGTPITRLEFAVRLLSEALPTHWRGYDGIWLVVAAMLFNSAPLNFLLNLGAPPRDYRQLELFRKLERRCSGLSSRGDPDEAGPWPVGGSSQVISFLVLRMLHYQNITRPMAMIVRAENGGSEHGYVYVHLDEPERCGDPLTADDVWACVRSGLDQMKHEYPISYARYEPVLRSRDDLSSFLRWANGPKGREPVDRLDDARAYQLLENSERNRGWSVEFRDDLETWAAIVNRKPELRAT